MLRLSLFAALLLSLIAPCAHAIEHDESKAVILAYHHIGESQYPQSNISIDLFNTHIDEIINNDYTVLPLPKIITALNAQHPLPPKTVAITFEGGYRSAYQNAIPKLIENNIPFTIFIASDNTKIPTHLDWKTLKKIAKFEGASFGILPAQYAHISHLPKSESTRLINKSRIAFKKQMKKEVAFFSYPYGEISTDLIEVVRKQGFTAAFGLHSAPIHSGSNMLALPRFTMTSQYGDIDRFRMITNTLPLPATEIEQQNWKLETPLTQIGFTAPQNLENELKNLSCHISGQDKPTIEVITNRVEILPAEPISHERARLNCTLLSDNENEKQWRWFGMLFHIPQNN